jgi:hypothetical protein
MLERVKTTRLAAIAMAAVLLLIATVATTVRVRPQAGSEAATVVVIEELPTLKPGQGVQPELKTAVAALAPYEVIDWKFAAIDPPDVRAMRDLIAREHPKVVILLNESLLEALGEERLPTRFLVPSELPPDLLQRRYGEARKRQNLAFLSWYVDNQGKLLDHLTAIIGRKPTHVVALFHEDLVISGVERHFVDAAAKRGIVPEIVRYDSFDDFASMVNASRSRADAFFVPVSDGIIMRLQDAANVVNATRIPAAYSRADQVVKGGLLATAAPWQEIWEQLGRYTVLLLHGADASALEITQPTRLETTVNLNTARLTHQSIPFELLAEARWIRE